MLKGILLVLLLSQAITAQYVWHETTQNDFKDGTFERNLFTSRRTSPTDPDSGAVEFVPKYDLNNDGYLDLVLSHATTTTYIYWGSDSGYTPNNRTPYCTSGGGNCEGADLNADGFAELVIMNIPYLTIYWGTPFGPDPNNASRLSLFFASNEAMGVADLNKDGYLDLVAQAYTSNSAAIFWGSWYGYHQSNRTELPSQGGDHNTEIADLDRNGWLDLVLMRTDGRNVIYWGRRTGFSSADSSLLPYPGGTSHGCSVADLNRDGYLDLVFTAYNGASQTYIYWGSRTGYSTANRQALATGGCFGGSVVAHMNTDSCLDIIFFNGYGTSQKPLAYWGSTTGYSDSNRTRIGPTLDCAGGLIADYDRDGDQDMHLVIWNGASSYIAWGPSFTTWDSLPSSLSGHGTFHEIGNTYNRGYYEEYVSSVFNARDTVNWGRVIWLDSLRPGTHIDMYVRSGTDSLPDSLWSGWVEVRKGDSIHDSLNSQYLQYKAVMGYSNPVRFPLLWEVEITYDSLVGIEERTTSAVLGGYRPSLEICPNPTTGRTMITIPGGYERTQPSDRISLVVYDVSGHAVKRFYDSEYRRDEVIWFGTNDDGDALPAGVYFIVLTSDRKHVAQKVLIAK